MPPPHRLRAIERGRALQPVEITGNGPAETSRSATLDELDWVSVGIGHPGGAEAAAQKVVRRAQGGYAVGGQASMIAVDIVRPQNDLNRPSAELGAEAVIGGRSVHGGNPHRETVEADLYVNR